MATRRSSISPSNDYRVLTPDGNGNILLRGALTVPSNATVTGTMTANTVIATSANIADLDVTGTLTVNNVSVTGGLIGDITGNVSSTGLSTFANVDINSGSIDNTVIGASTPVSGTFTGLESNTLVVGSDATVEGILTANSDVNISGAVTIEGNLTVSGNVTTIESTTVTTEDSIIRVNSNGTSGVDVGLEANVSGSLKQILYTTTNEWSFGSENVSASRFIGDLSGNVTGDISGNVTGTADFANSLSSDVTIELSGDATGSATFVNSGDTANIAVTLSDTGVVANTYGLANSIAQVSVNSKGQLTSVSNVLIDILASQVSDFTSAARITISDNSSTQTGDGSLSYSSATGIITYTGPDQSEANARISAAPDQVRSHFSAGTGITLTNGVISLTDTNYISGVEAGSGLTGGGDSGNVTLDIGAGLGITVSADNVSVDMAAFSTDDLVEGSNLYYTTARVRSNISVANIAVGDGSLSYDSVSGVLTYIGPSASEVRAHFSEGTGVTIANGEISIGQPVGTTDNVQFNNVNVTGTITGTVSGQVSDISNHTTADLAEDPLATVNSGTMYYTDSRARSSISVSDIGGDGSLTYNSGTGVITYTGPSAAEVRAHFSNGTGILYDSGNGIISVNNDVPLKNQDATIDGNYTFTSNSAVVTNDLTINGFAEITGNVTATSANLDFRNSEVNVSSGSLPTYDAANAEYVPGSNTSLAANTAYVEAAISSLVGSAPDLLNTLGEISDALNNDENLATNVLSQISSNDNDISSLQTSKVDKATNILSNDTGLITINSGASSDLSTNVTIGIGSNIITNAYELRGAGGVLINNSSNSELSGSFVEISLDSTTYASQETKVFVNNDQINIRASDSVSLDISFSASLSYDSNTSQITATLSSFDEAQTFLSGDTVQISGASPSDYNGTYSVNSTPTDSNVILTASLGTSPAPGTGDIGLVGVGTLRDGFSLALNPDGVMLLDGTAQTKTGATTFSGNFLSNGTIATFENSFTRVASNGSLTSGYGFIVDTKTVLNDDTIANPPISRYNVSSIAGTTGNITVVVDGQATIIQPDYRVDIFDEDAGEFLNPNSSQYDVANVDSYYEFIVQSVSYNSNANVTTFVLDAGSATITAPSNAYLRGYVDSYVANQEYRGLSDVYSKNNPEGPDYGMFMAFSNTAIYVGDPGNFGNYSTPVNNTNVHLEWFAVDSGIIIGNQKSNTAIPGTIFFDGTIFRGVEIIDGNTTTRPLANYSLQGQISSRAEAGDLDLFHTVGNDYEFVGLQQGPGINLSLETGNVSTSNSILVEVNNAYISTLAQQSISSTGSNITYDNSSGIIDHALTTDDVSEGSNLYYTDEKVDDRVANLVVGGSNVTVTYDDANGTLTFDAVLQGDITEVVAGTGLIGGATTGIATLNVGAGPGIAVTADAVQLANSGVTAAVYGSNTTIGFGTTIPRITVDQYGRITSAQTLNLTTSVLPEGTNLYYTTSRANTAIDARVNKAFVDALNVDADTLDGVDLANIARTDIDETFDGDVTISGNLTVSGTTTTISAQSLTLTDNMLYLNQGVYANITNISGDGSNVTVTTDIDHNYTVGWTATISGVNPTSYNGSYIITDVPSSNSFVYSDTNTDSYVSGGAVRGTATAEPDVGFAAGYFETSYAHTGLFRDASDNAWKFFDGYTPEPDESTTIDTTHASFRLANVTIDTISGNAVFANATINSLSIDGNYSFPEVDAVESGQAILSHANGVLYWGAASPGDYVANIEVSGNGISVSNTAVEGGTYTIASNATANNTANTLVFRDGDGAFEAGVVTADTFNYNGFATTTAGQVVTTTTTSDQVLDSFSASATRSAKYYIQAETTSDSHITQLHLVHDGSNVFFTEFGTVSTSGLFTVNSDISGGNVRILVTPATTDVTFTFVKDVINAS